MYFKQAYSLVKIAAEPEQDPQIYNMSTGSYTNPNTGKTITKPIGLDEPYRFTPANGSPAVDIRFNDAPVQANLRNVDITDKTYGQLYNEAVGDPNGWKAKQEQWASVPNEEWWRLFFLMHKGDRLKFTGRKVSPVLDPKSAEWGRYDSTEWIRRIKRSPYMPNALYYPAYDEVGDAMLASDDYSHANPIHKWLYKDTFLKPNGNRTQADPSSASSVYGTNAIPEFKMHEPTHAMQRGDLRIPMYSPIKQKIESQINGDPYSLRWAYPLNLAEAAQASAALNTGVHALYNAVMQNPDKYPKEVVAVLKQYGPLAKNRQAFIDRNNAFIKMPAFSQKYLGIEANRALQGIDQLQQLREKYKIMPDMLQQKKWKKEYPDEDQVQPALDHYNDAWFARNRARPTTQNRVIG